MKKIIAIVISAFLLLTAATATVMAASIPGFAPVAGACSGPNQMEGSWPGF